MLTKASYNESSAFMALNLTPRWLMIEAQFRA